jgi:hypothetical protein
MGGVCCDDASGLREDIHNCGPIRSERTVVGGCKTSSEMKIYR